MTHYIIACITISFIFPLAYPEGWKIHVSLLSFLLRFDQVPILLLITAVILHYINPLISIYLSYKYLRSSTRSISTHLCILSTILLCMGYLIPIGVQSVSNVLIMLGFYLVLMVAVVLLFASENTPKKLARQSLLLSVLIYLSLFGGLLGSY